MKRFVRFTAIGFTFVVFALAASIEKTRAEGMHPHMKSNHGHGQPGPNGSAGDDDGQAMDMAGATAGREHLIKMKYNEDDGALYFEPARVEIRSGDTVTWVQTDDINEHNVVAYPDGIPQSAQLFEGPMLDEVGQKYSVTFTKPGTYGYHCHPHEAMGMKGVVIVDRESRPEELRKAAPSEMHHHQAVPDEDEAAKGHGGGHGH